jgi:cytidine deaminase
MDKTFVISFWEYEGVAKLPAADRELLAAAECAAAGAYAPYSQFHVGAALRLADGTIVCGSNQENAAYPSGLCAERTAIFAASAQRPECRDFEAIAIIGVNGRGERCEASPCGACRQVLSEYERNQGHPLRVVCYVAEDCVREYGCVADLLPFAFSL